AGFEPAHLAPEASALSPELRGLSDHSLHYRTMITDHLSDLVRRALERAAAEGAFPLEGVPVIEFERPRRREHGDWSTNLALGLAKGGGNPRPLAQALAERLPASSMVESVEVAGPGFLNFHLSTDWLHDVVTRAADEASAFGRADSGSGTKVNIEYVSANPTGPINVVSGRHAAIGDAIANLLKAVGCEVTREYYFNDAGRQLVLFAESIATHYLRHFDVEAELPEDGYRGDYVADLAREIAQEIGDELVHVDAEKRTTALLERGPPRMLGKIRASLERFGTHFDVWTLERSLHESGAVETALRRLGVRGYAEESDGALWFKATDLGDDKDRVLVRSNGAPTYLASDVAYFVHKFDRGFDRLIYLLGPDHHGTVARMLATAEALGYDRNRVEIHLVQVVTLSSGGTTFKASKRAGVVVGLDELMDEVGIDAARYTFLTRAMESPLEFDIELVKQQAPENPVFYVQYAHARICSILRRADEEDIRASGAGVPLDRLVHPSETELMRKLAVYEEVVPEAAHSRAPQRIARYIEELAGAFSAFYRDCKVISEDNELSGERLKLCVATKRVIGDGLGLLGVAAPEKM
ncbi:MAG: arginine--tRNA ligase, partial [Actinomycetota bacterium]|nr:arginine--tRNA ligase [Actinomycetota bacterium]